MSSGNFIVRVTQKSGTIELHEYSNKKKAMDARDRFRKNDSVESAKMFRADDAKRMQTDPE